MKERIKQFMDYKGISAGELAAVLEVQRSNISHILNGRNKPGAAFIEKLLLTYHDLNARWLLTGEGDMNEKHSNSIAEPVAKSADVNTRNTIPGNQEESKPDNHLINKIVLLLADGTFIDYSKKNGD